MNVNPFCKFQDEAKEEEAQSSPSRERALGDPDSQVTSNIIRRSLHLTTCWERPVQVTNITIRRSLQLTTYWERPPTASLVHTRRGAHDANDACLTLGHNILGNSHCRLLPVGQVSDLTFANHQGVPATPWNSTYLLTWKLNH